MPKPLAINHWAALSLFHRKAMNILRQNNIKIYIKSAPKSIIFKNKSKEHFPLLPQKAVCNEIFTNKEICPPPLTLYIVLQDS